jgi:sec-independent protein translocase protein TatA
MGLPNIGPLELIIILAIALLVVGPRRLPEMGSAVGRTIREFRKASSEMTDAATVTPEAKPATPPQPNTLSGQAVPNVMPKVEPDTAAESASDSSDDESRQA